MEALSEVAEGMPECRNGMVLAKAPTLELELLGPDHPDRSSLQRFIADAYWLSYGARIHHFAQCLVGLRRGNGEWSAGLGYSLAGDDALFIEHYLDEPVEAVIGERLQVPVRRNQVVEVGNLAASGPGAGRCLIVRMAALLQDLGRPWIVFTSTRSLLNSFARLDLAPILLAPADPRRLPDQGRAWGSYYDSDPQVMTGNVHVALAQLTSRIAGSGQR